jgi:hypothetical protein
MGRTTRSGSSGFLFAIAGGPHLSRVSDFDLLQRQPWCRLTPSMIASDTRLSISSFPGEPIMKAVISFNAARRTALRLFGIGAAGTVIGAIVGAENLYAKHFTGPVTPVKLPDMVYDPELQMMVNPDTKQPIYEDSQRVATINATVTAGCANCPKCDDNCG